MLAWKEPQLKDQSNHYTYKHAFTQDTRTTAPLVFSIMSDEVFTLFSRVHKFVFIFKHSLNAGPM